MAVLPHAAPVRIDAGLGDVLRHGAVGAGDHVVNTLRVQMLFDGAPPGEGAPVRPIGV